MGVKPGAAGDAALGAVERGGHWTKGSFVNASRPEKEEIPAERAISAMRRVNSTVGRELFTSYTHMGACSAREGSETMDGGLGAQEKIGSMGPENFLRKCKIP
jgi:hypothetical protein